MEFNKIVKKIIAPNLKDFGFVLKEEYKGYLRFESNNLKISFTYDYLRSKDQTIYIVRHGDPRRSFTLSAYLDFLEEKNKEIINITPEKNLANQTELIVRLLKLDNNKLLLGRVAYIKDIEEFVNVRARKSTEKMELEYIERKSREAWQLKNYKKLVELIEPVYDKLPGSFQKKYNYAIKKLS